MMTRGMEMAIQAIIKMIGLDPQIVETNIVAMGKSVHDAAAEMRHIRKQNSAIMAHLGIAEPLTTEREHAERERESTGRIAGSA